MKSKRSLMTVLVGLAMLATPITAAAYDNNHYVDHNSHAARVSHPSNAPAHSFTPARNVPAAVTRSDFHNNAVAAHRDWLENRGTVEDYRNYGRAYGNRGYYPAPAYVAAPAYPVAAPSYGVARYGGGGACANAQRVVNTYYRDRNTGHPAAANDLLAQNPWAFHSGCVGGAPMAGGLFGGMPAYGNYGGYNGGYGQPYGTTSMLAPLIQQFVR